MAKHSKKSRADRSPGTPSSLAQQLRQAISHHQSGNLGAAEHLYRTILSSKSDQFDALHMLGILEAQRGRFEEALERIGMAVRVDPDNPQAHLSLGNVYAALGRFDQAAGCYEKALALKPLLSDALINLGNALQALGRCEEALASYDRALAIVPENAAVHNNRGIALGKLARHEEALNEFARALAIQPDFADALVNRGQTLDFLGRFEQAAASFERVLQFQPGFGEVGCMLRFAKMQGCDWKDHALESDRLLGDVRASRTQAAPFPLLSLSDSVRDQRLCAESWVRRKCPASQTPVWRGERYGHDRIRLAYCSADFHDHAIAYLMAGLFERHDRTRFETTAISLGPGVQSRMRSRLEGAFERFVDVRQQSDLNVANLLRRLEIDIAVDLNGFTRGCRTGIFALRPAPVQVNYLGYPATMGADYIDYILADRYVIPEEQRIHYAEKVVYLPDTFQANDKGRKIATGAPSRAEAGLPDQGFVFCSFNNGYKITPAVFDVWMRLLSRVKGSVMWLVPGNASAEDNLRSEASRRGVEPERIVFAPSLEYSEHLARIRLADLFLDTLPFNAGTTASDALWAGLPLLTCSGEAFAARMAGSLLSAVGLPELIAGSLEEYEALSLSLATDREKLAEIQERLAGNRDTHALFDTERFRRHLEAAYVTMWERTQRGEPPESFAVEPIN